MVNISYYLRPNCTEADATRGIRYIIRMNYNKELTIEQIVYNFLWPSVNAIQNLSLFFQY